MRFSTAVALAGLLTVGVAGPVLADDPPPADGSGTPVAEPVAPVDPAAPAEPVAPAVPAAPAPLTGFNANGGFGGGATFVPVTPDPAVVPAPPVNEALPEQVDEKGPFAQQISCDPQTRPGVVAFALLVSSHYGRPTFSGARPCIDYASFHHDGRALDWPLDAFDPADRQIADAVLVWLTAEDGEMARRFGIEYVIWNGLIWDTVSGTWRVYTGSPHTDHIHFSFTWDGAQMRTSWWTGVAVTRPDLGPCDVTVGQYAALHQAPRLEACEGGVAVTTPGTGLGRVRPGETGPGVAMLQEQLGVATTGTLDEETREALVAWQEEHDIPATGVADDLSYAVGLGWDLEPLPPEALAVEPQEWQTSEFTPYLRTTLEQGDEGEAVETLQAALGVEVDGSFGPLTAEALTAWEATVPLLELQAERRGDGTVAVTPLTWLMLERTAHPTLAVRDVALEEGSLDVQADPDGELARRATLEGRSGSPYGGGAVTLLQRLLDVDDDGSFGPATAAAVAAVQESAGLEPTGTVDGPTWAAVEAAALEDGRLEGAPGAAEARAAEKKAAEKKAAEKKAAEAKAAEAKAAEKKAAEKKAAEKEAAERAQAAHEAAMERAS